MSAESTLLAALRSCSTGLGSDDVSWAFQNPKTSVPVTAWVTRYLTDSTLLTYAELEIYNHLQKNGNLKKLIKQNAVSATPVLPQSQDSLRAQTEELKTSTEQLRQQTAVLKVQKAALDNMKARQKAERERKKKMEASRRRKWQGELEEMQAGVDDFIGILNEEIADLRSTIVPTESDAAEVTRLLESDDRVLSRLERLAAELIVPDTAGGEQQEVVKRVQDLADKLSILTQQLIRTRLDRVYLETLQNSAPPRHTPDAAALANLQSEIDTLHAEIPAVAANAADAEFLAPLMAALKARRAQRGENYVLGGTYTQKVLQHLTNRNAAITSLLQSSQDRDAAVLSLLATIAREAAAATTISPQQSQSESDPLRPSTPPNDRDRRKRLSMSPLKRSPTKQLGRIPFLTPARHRRRGSLDHSLNKTEFPELALLGHLGVSTITTDPPSDAAVAQHVTLQTQKVETLASAWSELVRDTMNDAGAEAEQIRIVLNAALTGGYPMGQRGDNGDCGGIMRLVDEGLRDKINDVERTVDTLAKAAGALNKRVEGVTRNGAAADGGAKAAFVGRWRR